MEINICIASQVIKVKTQFDYKINQCFEPFITQNEKYDLLIEFIPVETLEINHEMKIKTEDDSLISILELSDQNLIGIKNGINGEFIAIGNIDKINRKLIVQYIGKKQIFDSLLTCFNLVGIENILYFFDSFILHASLISFHGKGIAFIGPSGIGKSTRADICRKYAQAEIINGDRTIIKKIENRWFGFGSPYAGSSKIFVNKGLELDALLLVRRNDEREIPELKKMDLLQSIKEIFKNSTNLLWNEKMFDYSLELAKDLCASVSVYELICQPDQKFINKLKEELGV